MNQTKKYIKKYVATEMEQKLGIITEKMKLRHANSGLLMGKMGRVLYLYLYAQHIDSLYEKYANRFLDEIIDETDTLNGSYIDGIAGIGAGIEYLVQEGLVEGETNEMLKDFDKIISHIAFLSPDLINLWTGTAGYGVYYLLRLKSQSNSENENLYAEKIKHQLSKIVDTLSANYFSYEDLYFVINFLPEIIRWEINKEKAIIYLNYAVDLLETMVYEDTFFNKNRGAFNPLIAALLLFRSSKKLGDKRLADKASWFLEKYELGYRPYLEEKYAVKWSFLYHSLGEICNRDQYKILSKEWMNKITDSELNLNPNALILSGMMLLSMNKSISDNWLDLFPLF